MAGLWLCNRDTNGMERRLIPLLGAVAFGAGALTLAQDEPANPAEAVEEAAQPAEAPAEKSEETAKAARALVGQLADDSYRVREAATKRLWELGEVGMLALEDAVKSEDPELAYRSKILLRRIRTGITPDTPPKVVALVQRYFTNKAKGKKEIFGKLYEERAFVQMLRLYHIEEDRMARAACLELANRAVMPAVLGALTKGRLEESEGILRLAPRTDENRRRLASLLRLRGTLAEELTATEGSIEYELNGEVAEDSLGAAGYRLALLRSHGDAAEARELAQKMGRDDLVASLALLEGDPIPYLNWVIDNEGDSPVVRIHAEAAMKRWQGDEEGAAKLMRNVAKVARDGGEEARDARLSLLLNGFIKLALPLAQEENKESAFAYYESTEQPLKALEVIGYAGDAEAKKAWVAERLEVLREDWSKGDPREDILTVAAFLQSRGEEKEGRELMKQLSEIAAAQGKKTWYEFLGQLNDRGSSHHELAFYMAAAHLKEKAEAPEEKAEAPEEKAEADAEGQKEKEKEKEEAGAQDKEAKDEENKLEGERARALRNEEDMAELLKALFGEGDSAPGMWKRVAELEADPAARILLLGGIYGLIYLEEGKLRETLDQLLASAEKEEPAARKEALTALLVAAESRDDPEMVLALVQKLAEGDEEGTWDRKLASIYSYLSQWDKAASHLENILKREPENWHYTALYGGTLLRNGKPEEGLEALKKVELIVLDEPSRLRALALAVDYNGASKQAEALWRRLMISAPPKDMYWESSASNYGKHARLSKQWRVAAAMAEVEAMQYINSQSTFSNPVVYLRQRFNADLFRGLALLQEGDKENGIKLLRRTFELLNGDASLADDYFPLLREAGALAEHKTAISN